MTPDRTLFLTIAVVMITLAAVMWATGKLLDRRQRRRAWLRDGRQRR